MPKLIKKLPYLGTSVKSLDMSRCTELKVIESSHIRCNNETIVFPIGVEEIGEKAIDFGYCRNLKSIFLPPTIKEVETGSCFVCVYCYAPEMESVKTIIEDSERLLVLPQYYDSYHEQAEAEGVEDIEDKLGKIPDDKLYFYDE